MSAGKVLVITALAVAALGMPAGAADRLVTRRFGVIGEKYRGPQTRMSAAGVTWSFTKRVMLELTYERTGYAPIMPVDHDDGIMTGIKINF
jgi:hypothetical protein